MPPTKTLSPARPAKTAVKKTNGKPAQDYAAAAVAKAGIPVFAFKGESLEEYWDFTLAALSHPGGLGPQLVVDDGGDATLLLHKGCEMEQGSHWVNSPSASHEEDVIKK